MKGDGIGDGALERSFAMQARAAARGFDWPSADGVLDKIEEEVGEVRQALLEGDLDHARQELGDVLFAAVNLARFLHIAPAAALEETNQRFARRFAAVCQEVERRGRVMESCALDELEAIWQAVKPMADKGVGKPLDNVRETDP